MCSSKKPRLILHIGLQKTGTCSIQIHLNRLSDRLRQYGYYYPDLPPQEGRVWNSPFRHGSIAGTLGDFQSAFDLMSPEQDELFWLNLKSSDLCPIISAEAFSRIIDISKLRDRLTDFSVKIIVYLRRQDGFVESLYNQRNKILLQRKSNKLIDDCLLTEEGLYNFIRNGRYSPILNYERLTKTFGSLVEDGDLIVRPFDRKCFFRGNVCYDFFEQLGIKTHDGDIDAVNYNSSVANIYLNQIVRAYCHAGPDAAKFQILDLSNRLVGGEDLSGDYRILSQNSRRAMLSEYQDVNEYIERRYSVNY